MTLQIKKAVRIQRKARIDITGPSGSGKTYTALKIASGMGEKILVIDSEQSSSSLYADEFNFDVIELPDHTLPSYFTAIKLADGYDVVVIDSISHAWEAVNEEVTAHAKKSRGGNSFQAWGEKGNPLYNQLLDAVLKLPAHVIVTMRVKSDYVMEEYTGSDGKTKSKPVKIGLAPKFREGGEYEFDVVANLDLEHNLIVEKTRLSFLDGKVIAKPGPDLGKAIADWLNSGEKPKAPHPLEHLSAKKLDTNGVGGAHPVVPENPWLWKLQGHSDHKGKYIAALTDDLIKALKPARAMDRLYRETKLTQLDCEALTECFKNEDALLEARSQILGEEDYNGRDEANT